MNADVIPGVSPGAGAAAARPASPPAPEFELLGVEPALFLAAPTLRFHARARDESGLEIYTIALSAQVQVEPAMRTHDPETRARLTDLFGAPERWATSTKSLVWGRLGTLVPSFRGSGAFDLLAPLSFDLDLGVAKYLNALEQGEVPLTFHWSGSVVYRDGAERVQVVQVPWSQTPFALPVAAWRNAMDEHYPGRGWVGLRRETLVRLQRHKAAHGFLTLDDALATLLGAAGRTP